MSRRKFADAAAVAVSDEPEFLAMNQPFRPSRKHPLIEVPRRTMKSPTITDDPTEGGEAAGGLRILLAEDNLLNQMMIRAVLEDSGHSVDAVENGEQVVEAVSQGTYDIVLMDVSMPVMDGIQATQRIRKLDGPVSRIPIIALTANAMKGDRENYISLGVSDYLAKPIHIQFLLDALERQRSTLARKAPPK